MTPKERAVAALNLQTPDMVPTFELEFQLAEEMFGRPLFGAQFSEKKTAPFMKRRNIPQRFIPNWNIPLFRRTDMN